MANKYYDGRTWQNPDFQDYKNNNVSAFRALQEIIDWDGNLDDEKKYAQLPENARAQTRSYHEAIKNFLKEGHWDHDTANSITIAKKLNEFIKVWPEIKDDPYLGSLIPSMVSSFHHSWASYSKAIPFYTTRNEVPVYMDVADYLTKLIDENGQLRNKTPQEKSDLKTMHKDYIDLVADWKVAITEQYKKPHPQGEAE